MPHQGTLTKDARLLRRVTESFHTRQRLHVVTSSQGTLDENQKWVPLPAEIDWIEFQTGGISSAAIHWAAPTEGDWKTLRDSMVEYHNLCMFLCGSNSVRKRTQRNHYDFVKRITRDQPDHHTTWVESLTEQQVVDLHTSLASLPLQRFNTDFANAVRELGLKGIEQSTWMKRTKVRTGNVTAELTSDVVEHQLRNGGRVVSLRVDVQIDRLDVKATPDGHVRAPKERISTGCSSKRRLSSSSEEGHKRQYMQAWEEERAVQDAGP